MTLLVMRHKLFLIKPNDGYQGVNSDIGPHPCSAFYSVTINVSSRYSPVASRGQSPLRAYDHCSREESPLATGLIHPALCPGQMLANPTGWLPIFWVGHAGAQRVHSTHQKTWPEQTKATGSNQSRQVTW